MHIVLVDSELELVSDRPVEHYSFDSITSFRDIPVLDAYFHAQLMKGMPEGERRGRPDILHRALSLCQNSIPNNKGLIDVRVHTREEKVISLDPHVDIPPNYVEFLQQMGRLLRGSPVKGFEIKPMTLRQLLDEIGADSIVAMTPLGEERPLKDVLEERKKGSVAVLIGGFHRGDFCSPVYELADVKVSLGSELLTVPTVVSEVLSAIPRK
jgi:rRNA small subunit pseudouridine methyltransferase Nep1